MANGINQSPLVTIDQTIGLRSWGLILYGALPANITVVGTLQQNVGKVNNLLYLLLAVSVIPLILTFLLIRSRQREWYLTYDRLFVRSAITTALIVSCASLVAGLSGVIHGKYVVSTANILSTPQWIVLAESFLLGIGSLVISSALFITIITKNSELPGLPPPKLVESLAAVREKIRYLQASPIWDGYIRLTDDELKDKAEELEDELEKVFHFTGNKIAKKSLEPVRDGVTTFIDAIDQIQQGGNETSKEIIWQTYFAPANALTEGQLLSRSAIQNQHLNLLHLKELNLGGRDV